MPIIAFCTPKVPLLKGQGVSSYDIDIDINSGRGGSASETSTSSGDLASDATWTDLSTLAGQR